MKNKKDYLKKRIIAGIKFFRLFAKNYDEERFRRYWPKFLELVERYINGRQKI